MALKDIFVVLLIILSTVSLGENTPNENTESETKRSYQFEDETEDYRTLFPGHLKPLGYGTPYEPVETYRGFARPQVFHALLVETTSALFHHAAQRLGDATKVLRVEEWGETGLGLTTRITATRTDDNAKETMTLRNFHKRLAEKNDVEFEGPVPSELLKHIYVPRSLMCEGLVSSIENVLMRVRVGEESSRLKMNPNDQIICQMSGLRKVLLVDPMSVPNKTSVLDSEDGLSSNVDVNMVDLTKYTSLQDVIVSSVNLKPTDCLYIPYKWLYHSRVYERDVSLSFVWKHAASYYSCHGRIVKPVNMSLSEIDLLERVRDRRGDDEELETPFEYFHYFIDNYFIPEQEVKMSDFEVALTENSVIPKLGPGSQVIAEELFKLLDVDGDSVLSEEDLESAEYTVLEAIAVKLTLLMEELDRIKSVAANVTRSLDVGSSEENKLISEAQIYGQHTDSLDKQAKRRIADEYREEIRSMLDERLEEFLAENAAKVPEMIVEREPVEKEQNLKEIWTATVKTQKKTSNETSSELKNDVGQVSKKAKRQAKTSQKVQAKVTSKGGKKTSGSKSKPQKAAPATKLEKFGAKSKDGGKTKDSATNTVEIKDSVKVEHKTVSESQHKEHSGAKKKQKVKTASSVKKQQKSKASEKTEL